ncbi:MAG TPA: DUF924 family protein [Thermoanaerobaculia bacterium]|nr:DUF924 family protein [Thermoanaerobaculia bacterium]
MSESAPLAAEARAVLDYWFGPLDADGLASAEKRERWWRKDPAFDAEIRERFGGLWERAARGELDGWSASADGSLALIVVLDQLPRNMFRDRPEMFATDPRARTVVLAGIESGLDRALVSDRAVFFYMPLMHGESRIDQHLGMRLYDELVERSPAGARDVLSGNLDFMRRHFEIVDRFGRFPHRNAVLGRESTPEEVAFLEQPGSSF